MVVEPTDQPGAELRRLHVLSAPRAVRSVRNDDIKPISGGSGAVSSHPMGDRQHRSTVAGGLDRAPRPRGRGRARVYGADKVGVDAGELAGTDPVGVAATDDVDALVALDADCVLHMPKRLDVDELCRLLASGKNVVSVCAELPHARRALPATTIDRLEAACREGSSSLFATGSSPGFISDVVPIALLLLERSIDRVVIEEFANMSQRDSPQLLVRGDGDGSTPRGRRRPAGRAHAHELRPRARGARRAGRHPDRPRSRPRPRSR